MKIKTALKELALRLRLLGQVPTRIWAGDISPVGRLYAAKISPDGSRSDLGLISTKVVTTAGVAFVAGIMSAVNTATMRFHASGTGIGAEAITDTALGTDSAVARATGTQANSTNTYTTVGTQTYASALAITEHGIFSASTAGTLLDRSVFAAINVISGDSIEFTYVLTLPSGG